MRPYARVCATFWTGRTGRQLRSAGRDAQLVALYLVTCPAAQATGLYHLALPTLCHESGVDREAALAALAVIESLNFAYMDEAEEVVFVPTMARSQIGDALTAGDKRRSWVRKMLQPWRGTRYYGEFLKRYGDAYGLEGEPGLEPPDDGHEEDPSDGAPKEHRSPLDAPSKSPSPIPIPTPSLCFGGAAAGAAPPPSRIRIQAEGDPEDAPLAVVFKAQAAKKGPSTMAELTQGFVDSLKPEYEGIDVALEIKKAARWANAPENNPKIGSRGVRRFISNWLGNAEDEARRPRGNPR